jgi:hypothetical protein
MRVVEQLAQYLQLTGAITVADVEWLRDRGFLSPHEFDPDGDTFGDDIGPSFEESSSPEEHLEQIEEEHILEALSRKGQLPPRSSKGAMKKRRQIRNHRGRAKQQRDSRRKQAAEKILNSINDLPSDVALVALVNCLNGDTKWIREASRQALIAIARSSPQRFVKVVEILAADKVVSSNAKIAILKSEFLRLFTSRTDLNLLLHEFKRYGEAGVAWLDQCLNEWVDSKVVADIFGRLNVDHPIKREVELWFILSMLRSVNKRVRREAADKLRGLSLEDSNTVEMIQAQRSAADPYVVIRALERLMAAELLETLSDQEVKRMLPVSRLELRGVKYLSDTAFSILSEHQGTLSLRDIESISRTQLRALSKNQGDLDLSGLKKLTCADALELWPHVGALKLDGLKCLPVEAARLICLHNGDLWLQGLQEISGEVAECLSKVRGSLYLNGVQQLCDKSAQALGQHKGSLLLNGVKTLSVNAATSLANHHEPLWLCAVDNVSDDVIASFSQHKGTLWLNGLRTLSEQGAFSLGMHSGAIYLNGLRSLSDEALKLLSRHDGPLWLAGLTALSIAAAEFLADHKGELGLLALRDISPEVNEALSRHVDRVRLRNYDLPGSKNK